MGSPVGKDSCRESTPGKPAGRNYTNKQNQNNSSKHWTTQRSYSYPHNSGVGLTKGHRCRCGGRADPPCSLPPGFAARAVHVHVVAGFALVSAGGAHVMVALEAAGQQRAGVGDHGGSVALQLAVGFGEGPQPIFQAGQPRAQS